jgi:TolB-like protein
VTPTIPQRAARCCSRAAIAVLLLATVAAGRATAHPAPPTAAPAGRTVAVLPLGADPRDSALAPLAYGLADLLVTDLARSKQLTLVERARLGAVLRELSVAAAGTADSAAAPRAGRLLGARTLVLGSLGWGTRGDVVFSLRLVDVGTGRVDLARDTRAPLADILAAEKELAMRLFDALGVQLTPLERALVERHPTKSLAALIAYGQGARAEVNGQYAAAMRAFRRAAAIDPGFREARERADAARDAATDAAGLAVNGVNRPLESVPTSPRAGLASDPEFAVPRASITVRITRP